MNIGIPEKEIKQTLANVDATLHQTRISILPRIETVLIRVDDILSDVQAVSSTLRAIFVKKP